MNTLRNYINGNYINESVLGNEDTLVKDKSALIIQYICDTYVSINKSKLNIRYVNGEYVADYDGPIFLLSRTTTLVDNNFKWGRVWSMNANGTNITSLEGAPEECEFFDCNHTNITSLEGAPKKCKEFWCFATNITSLEGAPEECEVFDCNSCKKLKSLKGAPQECIKFKCNRCDGLKSLKGAPKKCEIFDCRKCTSLTSFDGIPNKITKMLDYSGCVNLKDAKLPSQIKCKIKS